MSSAALIPRRDIGRAPDSLAPAGRRAAVAAPRGFGNRMCEPALGTGQRSARGALATGDWRAGILPMHMCPCGNARECHSDDIAGVSEADKRHGCEPAAAQDAACTLVA